MNKQRTLISVTAGLLCALVGGMLTKTATADPIEHPHYLHALADLRTARAWITEPVQGKVNGKEADAVAFIDKAIEQIRKAQIDDGKSLKEHDAVDATAPHKGRLRKAFDLLRSANKDLHMKEDDKAALGWRTKAIRNVDFATLATGQALNETKEK